MNENTNPVPPNCFKNFTGSVDELLQHAQTLDPNAVEAALESSVPLSDDEHLDTLMEEFRCTREEAAEILQLIKEEEVKQCCDDMVSEGILEIYDYVDGEPRYRQTELGVKIMEEEKRRREAE
jgi:hypothetical protein